MSRPRQGAVAVAVAAAVLVIGGCAGAGDDEVERDIERVAAQARSAIDELAAAVGTDPEVQQDVITDCVPGDKESGKDLVYDVRVKVAGDALAQVRGPVADRYRTEGWDVAERANQNTVFRKDGITMGVTVFPDDGLAAVSGTGGCVR